MNEWKQVAHIDDIPIDQIKTFSVDDQEVIVYCNGSNYHVYPNLCTHQAVPLSDGHLINGTVICRLHGAKYDLNTGDCLKAPARTNLQPFHAEVAEDILYIDCSNVQQVLSAYPKPMKIRSRRKLQRILPKSIVVQKSGRL